MTFVYVGIVGDASLQNLDDLDARKEEDKLSQQKLVSGKSWLAIQAACLLAPFYEVLKGKLSRLTSCSVEHYHLRSGTDLEIDKEKVHQALLEAGTFRKAERKGKRKDALFKLDGCTPLAFEHTPFLSRK